MHGWHAIDFDLFRLVNQTMSSSVLDGLFLALVSKAFGWFMVGLVGLMPLFFGGRIGRRFVFTLLLTLAVGEVTVLGPLKNYFARPRPYVTHPAETRLLVGRGSEYQSLPSSHAANFACIAAVAFLFRRRSLGVLGPLALLVGYSRPYLGVHYPSDVLAGWLLGAGIGLGVPLVADYSWQRAGRRWFPLWWARFPHLVPRNEDGLPATDAITPGSAVSTLGDLQWLRAGSVLVVFILGIRLLYLHAGILELSEDEAYQWLWSKHMAWSYYSKPPGIAVAQWLGTHLFGDSELGVRFCSPFLASILGLVLLRFVARFTSGRTAFFFLLIVLASPLLTVGSILITIDPLLVFFWTLSLVFGWRALTENSMRHWVFTGLCWGATFQCKFASPFLWASWALFFAVHPPSRNRLKAPGLWIAFGISLVAMIPVLLWNYAHGWPTAQHLVERGGLSTPWKFKPDFLFDFLLVVPLLINPLFFVAILLATRGFWRASAGDEADGAVTVHRPLLRYLFCLGSPVFLFYLGYTLRARVQPNWIAASVIPLLLFAVIYWHRQAEAGNRLGMRLFRWGVVVVLPLLVVLHETNLVRRITGKPLPAKAEPLKRVRGYREMAQVVGYQRQLLERQLGKPTFIIADHYGRTGLLSFYLPEAKETVGTPQPMVVVESSEKPENQFWFWPEYRYESRQGMNAIYVIGTGSEQPPPERLVREFQEVRSLGMFNVEYRGRTFHQLQIFACVDKR